MRVVEEIAFDAPDFVVHLFPLGAGLDPDFHGVEFERAFAQFLENASDVRAFAKLPGRFGFAIEYTDSAANLRYYEPDFVAVDAVGQHFLIETKGREDIDVTHKDRAACIWCENATLLTDVPWQYVKVPQLEWNKLQPADFAEVQLTFGFTM